MDIEAVLMKIIVTEQTVHMDIEPVKRKCVATEQNSSYGQRASENQKL
jgi:hypothetical protein